MPILASLRDALAAESVIVVDEMAMPEMDVAVIRDNYDMIMMDGFASTQRTEAMWTALFGKSRVSNPQNALL